MQPPFEGDSTGKGDACDAPDATGGADLVCAPEVSVAPGPGRARETVCAYGPRATLTEMNLAEPSVLYFASGSGRSWNLITLLVVPLPVSMWNGARVLTVDQMPRPFHPAAGSSMRPSIHFA
jgi:hypothetical protein